MKRRIIIFALCMAIITPVITGAVYLPNGVPKPFFAEQAQSLALAKDSGIKKKNNQIVVKRMKYVEAVEAIKAKAKNLRSFRWSPLLSFKFPEKLDLIMEYDLTVKPLNLQTEITTLIHERNDMVFDVKRKVIKLFISVYIYQERITFQEELLEISEEELRRNTAKLVLGTASQADIDTMEKSIEKQIADIAFLKRSFETDKKELSDLTGLDVTSGYVFKNPLKTASITRSQLEVLVEYTLENDHLYYSARMTEAIERINMDSYENLFRRQYGSKVDAVSIYLGQARNGYDVDTTAFKTSYDAMLKSFDQPWDGKKKILFFTFTKEWLKGEISGTRYIEDEMYALYTATLEYIGARKDKENMERALLKQIAAEYESLITAKNSMDALLKTLEETKDALDRLLELNRRGKASFSEVQDKREDYQELQLDAVEALAFYNELLFDFDRLTCGGVSKLLAGAGLDTDAGQGADSNKDRPTYYIYTDVASLIFVFGVNIPDDYEPEIDSFEVWYEGYHIGERLPVGTELRHLALDYGETSMLTVRLFNGDEYIDECEIDTTVPTDVLNIKGATRQTAEERVLGNYSIVTEQRDNAATSEITFHLQDGVDAKYYRISFSGMGLYTGEHIPITEPFKYLTLLTASLDGAAVEFYDENRQILHTARFEQMDQSIREV